jgi:hypothetical protein
MRTSLIKDTTVGRRGSIFLSFRKFKSYNKEGLKTANIAKTNQVSVTNKENPDMLLKENANRYTWEGRFLDYKILQKVDKKITDKRLATSFSEFKRMQCIN